MQMRIRKRRLEDYVYDTMYMSIPAIPILWENGCGRRHKSVCRKASGTMRGCTSRTCNVDVKAPG